MEKRKNKALSILEFDKILNSLAQFTSNAIVLQFHRRFMNAANGAK